MATLQHHTNSAYFPTRAHRPSNEQQIRHDRWLAILVLVAVIAMIALITWLASMGGGIDVQPIDTWSPMM